MSRKQTLSLHIGQAGIQLGSAIWELLALEHGIKLNGVIARQYVTNVTDKSIQSFFYSSRVKSQKFAPRCLFIDTESMVLDEVRAGSYKNFFPSYTLISGEEDAANLYPRGYATSNQRILSPGLEALRRLYETSDNMHGLMLFRSVGGGTGSGGSTAFLNKIEKSFSKMNISEFTIIPAPCISTSIVEPYNTILALFQTMHHTNLSLILDNQALYGISKTNLNISNPSYFNINKIVAQVFSSITASLRFESVLSSDFNMYQTNLIPFPLLKYPVISYAPIISTTDRSAEPHNIHSLTEEVFKRKNFMVKCFPDYGEHMACAILYRGEHCKSSQICQALELIKGNEYTKFVDWCPTGFKIGITRQPPPYVQYSCLSKIRRAVCLITNTTCISQVIDYLLQKFDILYQRKAYVHWFTGEGLEEAELVEAREGVLQILLKYLNVMTSEEPNMRLPDLNK